MTEVYRRSGAASGGGLDHLPVVAQLDGDELDELGGDGDELGRRVPVRAQLTIEGARQDARAGRGGTRERLLARRLARQWGPRGHGVTGNQCKGPARAPWAPLRVKPHPAAVAGDYDFVTPASGTNEAVPFAVYPFGILPQSRPPVSAVGDDPHLQFRRPRKNGLRICFRTVLAPELARRRA